ncbi:hypothetical protein ACLB2K_039598 [Fragaria x ananassa]
MLVLLVAVVLCAGSCYAASAAFKVGGPDGWTIGVDYNQWSSSKEFHVGDALLFSYQHLYHNVFEVTKQDYESCDPSSPITAYSSGSDTITLEKPGHYYFLCGAPHHCEAGQKVEIVVSNLPTPVDSPVISPSPTPSRLFSPSSTPSQAPSGLSTSSTPSPSPSTLSTSSTPSPTPSALSSTVYKVGGPGGWIIGVDYNQWSSPKEFLVGDTLLFSYNSYHNVMEVTEPSFKSCNSSSPIAAYSSGSDYITLERPGHYYFLCGAPRHCEAGQKVEVVVSLPTTDDHVSSPSLAPSGLSTPSTPSPAPSPSTPRPQERLPHSAATTTINAPKLALGQLGVFVFLLTFF